MKKVLAVVIGLALTGLLLQAADEKKPQPEPKAKMATLPKGLEKYDTNNDGKLDNSEREAMREARRKEFMDKWDKNHDGKLDEQELKAFREDQMKLAAERSKQMPPIKPVEKKSVTK